MIHRRTRRSERTGGLEAEVTRVWTAAFRRNVTGGDDFFQLGGDSLTGLLIAGDIEQRFGIALGLDAFTTARTPAAMARMLGEARAVSDGRHEAPTAVYGAQREYPLSLAQEPLWRYCQALEARGQYGKTAEFEVAGHLDARLLREALTHLVERHSSLRTVFAAGPVQRVLDDVELPLSLIDATGARDPEAIVADAARAAANREYDLERGPLAAATLVRLAPQHSYVVLAAHNLICDKITAEIIWRELCEEYGALELGRRWTPTAAVADYGAFALRQRRSLEEGSGELARWRALLAGAPARLELPFARELPDPLARPEKGTVACVLPVAVRERVDELAQAAGVTRYMLRLAAFAAQLGVDAEISDLVVGVYVPGRPGEHRETVGLFLHLGVVRLQVEPARAFGDWLEHVRDAVATIAGSQLPYEVITAALQAEGIAAPQVTAIFDAHAPREVARLGGHPTVRRLAERRVAEMPWGFHALADTKDDALVIEAQYDARLYDPFAVGAFIERTSRFFERACEDPHCSIAMLAGA